MESEFRLIEGPISCYAYNLDKSMLILSPNTKEIHIYRHDLPTKKYVLDHVLKAAHGQKVTGLDWSPRADNCFVSCSQDRNAFVWTLDERDKKTWIPKMVLLRLSHAATQVKWSPDGTKFAVSSSSKMIALCYYEEKDGWWKSKHIKDDALMHSTITCVCWHPNSSLIAVGSTDFHVRVFSAALKEIDAKPPTSNWMEKVKKEGSCLADFEDVYSGYITAVQFSGSGNQLAWVSHSSLLSVATGPINNSVITIPTTTLPYTSLVFANESTIIAAGHDCKPYVYTKKDNATSWELTRCLDQIATTLNKNSTDTQSAINMFKKLDIHGQKDSEQGSTNTLPSINQNSIIDIKPYQQQQPPLGPVSKVSTLGLDGRIVVWRL